MKSLRQAEVLRAILLTRSVSGAASLLAVSPAAVSRMLRHTEDQVGFRLFDRTREGFMPVPEARAIFEHLEVIHEHLSLIQAQLRPKPASRQCLRLGASPGLGISLIPHVIEQLVQAEPTLTFELDILHLNEVVPRLESGEIDAAFTIYDIDDRRVRLQTIAKGRIVCLVPQEHVLARRASVSVSELADYPLIGFDAKTFQQSMMDQLFSERGLTPEYRARSRLMVSACALVRAKIGITLLDEFTAFGLPFSGTRAIPLEEALYVPLNLVNSVRGPLSQAVMHFVGELRKTVAQGGHEHKSR